MTKVTVNHLPSCNPQASKSHHVGSPVNYFKNPWPSYKPISATEAFSTRFLSNNRNFVPIPESRKELVTVRKPDWGRNGEQNGQKLKATWIGHASWLIETSQKSASASTSEDKSLNDAGMSRGVRILLDPVFSERTSPVQWFGPKRYSPTPCSIPELADVDLCIISHSHFDHLDFNTIKELHAKHPNIHFVAGLGTASWFLGLGIGITEDNVTELDWWDSVNMDINGVGSVKLTCAPAQHAAQRSLTDRDKMLWASWVIEETVDDEKDGDTPRKLYFAGDTGYRHVPKPNPTPEEEAAEPHCPAFAEIGNLLGPFDLALLPIGLYTPRDFMSSVHCSPEDSLCIHQDIKSKKSIGMHYGTFRGGISAQYEDVRRPPRHWREVCDKAGLSWGEEVGLCDIGDTVTV